MIERASSSGFDHGCLGVDPRKRWKLKSLQAWRVTGQMSVCASSFQMYFLSQNWYATKTRKPTARVHTLGAELPQASHLRKVHIHGGFHDSAEASQPGPSRSHSELLRLGLVYKSMSNHVLGSDGIVGQIDHISLWPMHRSCRRLYVLD